MHTFGNRLQQDPGFKRTSKSRLVVTLFRLCNLLKWPTSKISELEKQVQLLATVVNTRGQSAISSFSPSFGPQIMATPSRHPQIQPIIAGRGHRARRLREFILTQHFLPPYLRHQPMLLQLPPRILHSLGLLLSVGTAALQLGWSRDMVM
jgi:hypothetical protein